MSEGTDKKSKTAADWFHKNVNTEIENYIKDYNLKSKNQAIEKISNETDLSNSTVKKIISENTARKITLDTAVAIADHLGVTLDDLCHRSTIINTNQYSKPLEQLYIFLRLLDGYNGTVSFENNEVVIKSSDFTLCRILDTIAKLKQTIDFSDTALIKLLENLSPDITTDDRDIPILKNAIPYMEIMKQQEDKEMKSVKSVEYQYYKNLYMHSFIEDIEDTEDKNAFLEERAREWDIRYLPVFEDEISKSNYGSDTFKAAYEEDYRKYENARFAGRM